MPTKTADDYVALITPWQSVRARFVATVRANVQPYADAQAVDASLPASFDLDYAIGAQLDATGQWIGPTRYVPIPIPNAYFSWGNQYLGWGSGYWKGPYGPQFAISALDDDTYRRLLQAVVLANHWDGTIAGAQAVFDTFFIDPDTYVFLQDKAQAPYPKQTFAWSMTGRGWGAGVWRNAFGAGSSLNSADVEMSVCIAGKIPSPVLLGLLAQNALRIKPGGVTVNYRITSVDRTPLFGFGVQNKYVSGWGTGSWGVTPQHLLNRL